MAGPLPNSASQPPTGLRERKKQQTREALVDAGLRLFVEHGFAETTLDEVCAQAEVSKRTFFRYFTSKEDLALDPSHELWSTFLGEMESLRPSGGTVFEALQEVLLAALDKMTAPRWAERMAACRLLAEVSPSITAHNLSFCDRISSEACKTLSARLALADPEDLRTRLAQDLLVAAFQSAVERWAHASGRKTALGLRTRLQHALAAAAQVTMYAGTPAHAGG
ncbi:TetR family transcriptional regulator [Streptomyces misionensis]|uniref:TetR family transcriptional regulator n=1 Tax=Streptomyces misionensis TaxID=67331 RepID=UPI0033B0D925